MRTDKEIYQNKPHDGLVPCNLHSKVCSHASSQRKQILVLVASSLWLCAIGTGFLFLLHYERIEGPRSRAPARWPEQTTLARTVDDYTLVLFIHPKCPCSEASLSELAVLVTRHPSLKSLVVFVKPDGVPAGWENSSNWEHAARIPGVRAIVDVGSKEAGLFGARTSGEILLYDRAGKLVFSGGITPGRGHEGDSPGLASIDALLSEDLGRRLKVAPVYGCPLKDNPKPNREIF